MTRPIKAVAAAAQELRESYRRVKAALPWLDALVYPDAPPAFPKHASPATTPFVKVATANPELIGKLHSLVTRREIAALRLIPAQYSADACTPLLKEMETVAMPLFLRHTEVGFEEISRLAGTYPQLPLIIESGPRKLIYHYTALKDTLQKHANVYLCTFNFLNWRGHEEFVAAGYGSRLIYGSHAPLFAEDAAMAPLIMGDFDWQTKCDIAGNNLRRLLKMPPVLPPECPFRPPPPFIIDAHAHNLQPGARNVYAMPTPDADFTPADWLRCMDAIAVEKIFFMPGEALFDPKISCQAYTAALRQSAPHRFFYLAIFHPHGGDAHLENMRATLADPACLGIKIHPVTHKTAADDDAYLPIYELAARVRKPVMTHSWEISDYNPEQWRSHPDRFRRHLPRLGAVPFILGHAGGRPSAFAATVQLCRDFPNVAVDISGDYTHNGTVAALAEAIGAKRIVFGSDVDWIDPRCMLGITLAAPLTDAELADVLCGNAERLYQPGK